MIQRRENFSFALKTSNSVRVLREGIRQTLDGHITFQFVVFCPIHFAHTTRANPRGDYVRAERRTDINYHSLYDTNEEYPQKGTKWTKAVSLLCLFAAISYSGGGPELSTLKNKVESVMSDKHELTRKRVTAETMAAKQRDISVSEFFAKNRHLLG